MFFNILWRVNNSRYRENSFPTIDLKYRKNKLFLASIFSNNSSKALCEGLVRGNTTARHAAGISAAKQLRCFGWKGGPHLGSRWN